MPRIKHIAIRTRDVEKTAAFYRDAFGLKEVGSGQNGIYLSDGHINLAILKFRRAMEGEPLKLGIDHLGFQVDDIDAAVSRINDLGGKALTHRGPTTATGPSRPQSYYEVKCLGPDDQIIDISASGWAGAG